MYTELVKSGLPVFPVGRKTKRPIVAWKDYQVTLPSLDVAAQWDKQYPIERYNVGMATGEISGVVVIDIDDENGLEELLHFGFIGRTWKVKTGRGEHLYLKYPGVEITNRAALVPGVDVRGAGGYIIIPPSVHETGRKYEWVKGCSPDDIEEPITAPEWFILLCSPPKQERTNGNTPGQPIPERAEFWLTKYAGRATVGTRNVNLFHMGLQLHADGVPLSEAESIARQYAGMVGVDNSFTEKDAEKSMRSAYRGEPFQPATSQRPAPVNRALSLKPDAIPTLQVAEDYTDLPADPLFIDEKHMLQETMDMLLSVPEAMPKYPPVLFPIKLLHHLGGNTHYTLRGQLIYIMAAPGDGKTSFAELCAANIRKRGQDVIWYSPEWGKLMTLRKLQRYGGPHIDDISAHQVHYAEGLKGIANDKRAGQALVQEDVNTGVKLMADIMQWPGKAYHIVKASLTFDELVERTIAAIQYSRKQGGDPAWVIWDYLETLRRFAGNGAFWGETIADIFQALAIDYGVVPVLLHQPKKQVGEDVQNAAFNGEALEDVLLNGGSGQGITKQKCNLGITINPHRDIDGNPTGIALLNIYKNSISKPAYRGGAVKIRTDFANLTFIDET